MAHNQASNITICKPKALRRFATSIVTVMMMSLLMLAGCADENRQKIVGSWTMIKADKLARRVTPESDAGDAKSTDQPSEEMPADEPVDLPMMSLNFQSNGVLVTTTKLGNIDTKKTGTWQMVNFAPPSTMKVKCRFEEDDDQSRELEIKWIDDQTIRLAPPNMSGQNMKLNFKKQ